LARGREPRWLLPSRDAGGVFIVRVGGLGDEGELGAEVELEVGSVVELIVLRSGEAGGLKTVGVIGDSDGWRDFLDGGEIDHGIERSLVGEMGPQISMIKTDWLGGQKRSCSATVLRAEGWPLVGGGEEETWRSLLLLHWVPTGRWR
jgi:hypothetical protein